MTGDATVLAALQRLLKSEFTSMAQYRAHAQVFKNQGYKPLKHKLHGFFHEEDHHSKQLINRFLFLGGEQNATDFVPDAPKLATDVVAIFAADLERELQVVKDYNAGVKTAEYASDQGTAKLLRNILAEEEKHVLYLEEQLSLIRDIGKADYLSTKV